MAPNPYVSPHQESSHSHEGNQRKPPLKLLFFFGTVICIGGCFFVWGEFDVYFDLDPKSNDIWLIFAGLFLFQVVGPSLLLIAVVWWLAIKLRPTNSSKNSNDTNRDLRCRRRRDGKHEASTGSQSDQPGPLVF